MSSEQLCRRSVRTSLLLTRLLSDVFIHIRYLIMNHKVPVHKENENLTGGESGEYFLEDGIKRFRAVQDHHKHGGNAGQQLRQQLRHDRPQLKHTDREQYRVLSNL